MIVKNSIAGTLESNDVMVEIFTSSNGREVSLESVVKKQFGERILEVVTEVLDEYKIDNAKVVLNDKGALDYTIKARVKTAILRGQE